MQLVRLKGLARTLVVKIVKRVTCSSVVNSHVIHRDNESRDQEHEKISRMKTSRGTKKEKVIVLLTESTCDLTVLVSSLRYWLRVRPIACNACSSPLLEPCVTLLYEGARRHRWR